MPVLHTFVSNITDEVESGRVRPKEWNEAHVVNVDLDSEVFGSLPQSQVTDLIDDLAGKQPVGDYLTTTDEAGGDLSGQFDGLTVESLQLVQLAGVSAEPGHILVGNGIALIGAAMTGDGSLNSAGGLTLTTVNSDVGTFGDASHTLTVTVNAKGLITGVSTNAISIASTAITDFTEAVQDAVGSILTDTATIDFTYDDSGNSITADVKANSIAVAYMHASATDVLFGRSTASAGAGEEIVCTAAGRALIDDASAAAQRTTLGLGTLATQSGTFSGTSSGTNTGDQTTVSGNAGTATALQTARTIGGVSFDGTANIVPQTIQSVNEATDTTCFPLFISASGTQSLQPLNNAGLTYNSNTNNLTCTTFTGALLGNASTASSAAILTTARNINGVSFNGSADITVTAAAGTLTGTTLNAAVVTSSLTALGTVTSANWNSAGFVQVNGATSVGINCLASSNSANTGSTLTSNTSGHHARLYAEVVGNNVGSDPFIHLFNSDATNAFNLAIGGDSSDSGAMKIDFGTTIGSNTAFKMTTAGAASFLLGNLDVTKSASAATVSTTVSNSNNASGTANATSIINAGGASGGDPSWRCVISGVTTVSGGLDNSDSDAYKEQFSATVGTTPFRVVTTTGQQTLPIQAGFLAYLNSADNNVTGDGTFYNIGTNVAMTEIIDKNNDFNTNGTFTARVTGIYNFTGYIQLGQLTAAHTAVYIGVSTTQSFYGFVGTNGNARDSNNNYQGGGSITVNMTAGDTAQLTAGVFGSTKTVDILSGRGSTYFSGTLVN